MPVNATSATPFLPYPTAATAKPSGTTAATAGTAAAGDQVSLSPQAKALMAGGGGGKPPVQLKIEGGPLQPLDLKMMDRVMEFHGQQRDYMRQMMGFARESFGLGRVEDGGGLMLSGAITDVIKKTAAQSGLVEPEMPPDVAAWEAARRSGSEPEPPPSKAVQGTAQITLFIPEREGGGQVEIMFDNKAFGQLAKLSPEELKSGLADMLNGGAKGKAMNDAMKAGLFGDWMEENARYHPEWQDSKARFGYTPPGAAEGAHPVLMIQSKDRPDYVNQNLDRIVGSVLKLLKGAA